MEKNMTFLQTMSTSMNEMRTAEEFVDVVLVFEERRIPCHRVVLASTCEYFHRMFLTGMKESSSDEVTLNEIDGDTGDLLIGYLYSGMIEITQENALNLLAASEMLLLCDLKAKIQAFLCCNIHAKNCVSFLNVSRLYKLQDLIKDSQRFLNTHCKDVTRKGDLVELQEDDLVGILNFDPCEDSFRILRKWVQAVDGRDDRFMELVKNVDLSRFSKEFLCDDVMDDRLMQNVTGFKLIRDAMKSILLCENRTEVTFRYTVHNISSLGPTKVYSPEYYMRNLRWSVYLRQRRVCLSDTKESKPESLCVGVQCKSDSSLAWSCKVSHEQRLLKQKANGPPYTLSESQTLSGAFNW
ncbi:hypothetical protein CAPTEDRAFT_220776 [Capitella teleta]|uniref:BTB domain-containing protein n=1 Tax=Capitella teleta TaxID=283909 RepID=R7U937_CAPTE|nr:hypothetical protein CAPTEDRAFT_220776 [Capitella teleta]|eukprot:ELU02464.1 hypothetical protein CAPTEDRAFT_220776 [Capitella teleta]